MKKLMLLGLSLCLALVLAACGNDDDSAKKSDKKDDEQKQTEEQADPSEQAQEPVEITDKEKVDEKDPVVSVNGDEVKGDKYNSIYTQIKTSMQQYGQDVSDLDGLKDQTLDILVEQQLIKQDAADKGLEASDKEIESEYKSLKEENGEQLTAVLEQFDLSEDDFKKQLADDIITNKYMDKELEVKVTDDEVKEYYDQLKEQGGDEVGELDEMKDMIKDQLKQQKGQEELQAKVDKLKKDAKVDKLI
ncbi:ABC-type glycerol-3-phosphate transport system substrate-binding protein [Virgibacillus halotolerans]|uniref:SurA N-terminal domain-containing protein n=1 Tax=Virgibacillus halotolerans TaxID=1071053 RepID=UPI00196210B1|nr:SurA N-terminal domain-containing protein [Virgibacillus halotolerans]MBM7599787.1 ABC-type glycerol-3-phosphate transport system substrate-binding protein [Virgibacillus halotolerans]